MMKKYKKHLKELIVISTPMIIGNLGHVLTGATDVLVAAKHSVDSLAAIAIANSILFTVFILGLGILTGISIILSNYRGEKKPTKRYFISGVIVSQILALLTWLAIIAITFFVPFFGFEKHLVKHIQEYMFITSFSMFGMFLYQGIKEFLQAHEIVNFPNMILLVTVFVNLGLNFLLVFGCGPIPALGVIGLSLATLFVRTLLGISMVIYTWNIIKEQKEHQEYNTQYMKQVVKIGTPIGIGLLFEFLGFNIITICVGRIAGVFAATHNILLTLVDTAFMVPFAISSAIAIKVGYFNGAKNLTEIKNYSKVGVTLATLFMVFCSFAFYFKPHFFIGIFTSDAEIINIALPIVSFFSLFVIADGIQISLGGILKGFKMTKQVTACVLSSYWLVGIPLGFYLAYAKSMSLKGFWLGLTISLFLITILQSIIIFCKMKRLKNEY